MRTGRLPLFPLETVLFPNTTLSLHVFEERYKEMMGEVLAQEGEFGVVLARGNGILRTGCTASVSEVIKTYEDGRLDLMTEGLRRFHIVTVDTSRAFLQAEVEFFDDPVFRPARRDLILLATSRHQELTNLMESESSAPDADDPYFSFQLAQISPDLDFRQTLLDQLSEADRMQQVCEHLAELIERQKIQNAMKRTSRMNGHGKHLPGLES